MTIKEAILTLNANAVFACEQAGFDSTTVRMVEDALDAIEDALKAQEPRVMTLDEVVEHYSLPPVFVDDFGAQEDYYEDIRPLYFEFPYQKEEPWIVHWRGHAQFARYLDELKHTELKHTYNRKWRC